MVQLFSPAVALGVGVVGGPRDLLIYLGIAALIAGSVVLFAHYDHPNFT
jgi:hypothetical protein